MALIGEIRKRSWILIILVGLGMGGFLLMDMVQNNSSIFGSSTTVGKIDGKKISITEFQVRQNELYGNSGGDPYQIRDGLWEYYVREAILGKEAEAMGVGVGYDELMELQFGPKNISPIIMQSFGDPRTGQIDMNNLNAIKQRVQSGQLNPEERTFWSNLEDQIILERLQKKLENIVSKAIYTPTWMAEMEHNAQNQKIDFRFVGIPYASIKDEEVKVTDSELTAYIKKNKGKFMNDEEMRKLEYAIFNVMPTANDSAEIRGRLSETIAEFANAENDSLFVTNSTGGIYDEAYIAEEQVSPALIDTLKKVSVGTVVGPYVDGSFYKLAKFINRMVVPDSVSARHILIGPNQENADPNTYAAQMKAAESLADSLIGELKAGRANFDSLAAKYSTDASNKNKGGDLGIFAQGMMVKPFNDLCFFNAKTGEYKTVVTQFGLHIVRVDRKYESGKVGYKVAYIQESIIPSQETEKEVLREASKFVASVKNLADMKKQAEKNPKITLQTTPVGVKRNDYRVAGVGAGESGRNIVKWAYDDARVGDVSKDVYSFESTGEEIFIEKYVVVALQSIAQKGLATIKDENVRLQAETAVRNEKKAEIIKKKIQKGSLESIASAFQTQVQTASQVSFDAARVEGLGTEPKVVATAFKSDLNKVSEPIEGVTAVFLTEVTFKPEPTKPTDLPTARLQAEAPVRNQVNFRLYNALKKQTPIKDYRYKFF